VAHGAAVVLGSACERPVQSDLPSAAPARGAATDLRSATARPRSQSCSEDRRRFAPRAPRQELLLRAPGSTEPSPVASCAELNTRGPQISARVPMFPPYTTDDTHPCCGTAREQKSRTDGEDSEDRAVDRRVRRDGCSARDRSGTQVFTPGTVWTVTMVRMMPGLDQTYLQYLDSQFKKSEDAQVKAGLQKSYEILRNVRRRRRMEPVAPQGIHRPCVD
jgi:hypothetical protein